MAPRILPDVELMVLQILRTDEDLAELAPGGAHKRTPDDPSWPMLKVRRIGGAQTVQNYHDGALVQVEAWDDIEANGGSEFRARELAATAEAVLLGFSGIVEDLGVVTGVREHMGLAPLPDPDTKRPRYLFDVRVYVHPLRSAAPLSS